MVLRGRASAGRGVSSSFRRVGQLRTGGGTTATRALAGPGDAGNDGRGGASLDDRLAARRAARTERPDPRYCRPGRGQAHTARHVGTHSEPSSAVAVAAEAVDTVAPAITAFLSFKGRHLRYRVIEF